jgi:hypothetical protein
MEVNHQHENNLYNTRAKIEEMNRTVNKLYSEMERLKRDN